MKHGDRIAIALHEGFDNDEFICSVTQSDNKLLITDEQGTLIASIRQLSQPPLTGSSDSELRDMSRRAADGEEFPAPVAQIPKLHIPTSNDKALDKLAEIRQKYFRNPRNQEE